MRLEINKEISEYAKKSSVGMVWLDTINELLDLWNSDTYKHSTNYQSLNKTLYLNGVQNKIQDSYEVEDWFKKYTNMINLHMSLVCVKLCRKKHMFVMEQLDYLQIFWNRLNYENEIHAQTSNIQMN